MDHGEQNLRESVQGYDRPCIEWPFSRLILPFLTGNKSGMDEVSIEPVVIESVLPSASA